MDLAYRQISKSFAHKLIDWARCGGPTRSSAPMHSTDHGATGSIQIDACVAQLDLIRSYSTRDNRRTMTSARFVDESAIPSATISVKGRPGEGPSVVATAQEHGAWAGSSPLT